MDKYTLPVVKSWFVGLEAVSRPDLELNDVSSSFSDSAVI